MTPGINRLANAIAHMRNRTPKKGTDSSTEHRTNNNPAPPKQVRFVDVPLIVHDSHGHFALVANYQSDHAKKQASAQGCSARRGRSFRQLEGILFHG
jgi:hypothetical protein